MRHLNYKKNKKSCKQKLINKYFYIFRINNSTFEELKRQCVELFPSEDPNLFYYPFDSHDKNCTSAGGCLYNFYKTVRTDLRCAGLLSASRKRKADESLNENQENYSKKNNFLKLLQYFKIYFLEQLYSYSLFLYRSS